MKPKTLFTEFFQYVALNICGMIGLSCYILADTFFVSKGLGAKGLTALNLAIPVYSFVHGCGLMLGMGGAARYSIFRGQKKYTDADMSFSHMIYAGLALAAVFMLTGVFFSARLAAALGAEGEIFSMTKIYLQVILLFSPAFMMNDILICFVRNDGSPGLSMTAMLAGSLSNIVMDYIFIFPLQLGILGAVLATGCAPVISICILSLHRIKKQNHFHLKKTGFSPSFTAATLSLGLPSLITEAAAGIVMIIFNSIILRLQGNIGVAAYGVVANLALVVTSVHTGIAQGIQPMISRFYGYGKLVDMKKILDYAIISVLLISGFIYLVFLLAAGPITFAFNSEQNLQLQEISEKGLKLYFTAIPFAGFNIVLSTFFASTEKALPAQTISLSRGIFVIIPMAYLLSAFFKMTGIWLSYPVTESIVTFLGMILYKIQAQKKAAS